MLVQSGDMLVPDRLEPFVRHEYIKLDETSVGNEDLNIVTAGFNWYMKGHAAKLTMDILYALYPLVSGIGLDNDRSAPTGSRADWACDRTTATSRARSRCGPRSSCSFDKTVPMGRGRGSARLVTGSGQSLRSIG